MNITVNSKDKTITRARDNQTWTFAGTGYPNYYRRLCDEHGDGVVSQAMSAGDYYPPMLSPQEKLDLDEECARIRLAPLLD